MNSTLRAAFFIVVVRPVLMLVLGANVRGRDHLPAKGPAIIVANHNSHLDTLTIMAMFPLKMLPRVRPVAAMDYFLKSKTMAWFARAIIGIIPLNRSAHVTHESGHARHPLADCEAALDRGDILILFPEGSRGEPERLTDFKRGVAHLARLRPQTPVTPIFMHGLGKALPRNSVLFVPFNCDVVIGEPFAYTGAIDTFMDTLHTRVTDLAAQIHMPPWD